MARDDNNKPIHTTHKASTKPTGAPKGTKGIKCNVTLVWDVTPEQIRTLAAKQAIINAQSTWRTDGKLPSGEITVNVSQCLGGERGKRKPADPKRVAQRNMAKMSEADQIKFARELMAQYGLK